MFKFFGHQNLLYDRVLSQFQPNKLIAVVACVCAGSSQRAHVELPYYSKYLLLAAYFASYNPAKTDKRFFSKVGTFQAVRSEFEISTLSTPEGFL